MNNELRRHVPDAGAEALALLDPDRGPIEAPIRSEIFGVARFEQHARSLAAGSRSQSRCLLDRVLSAAAGEHRGIARGASLHRSAGAVDRRGPGRRMAARQLPRRRRADQRDSRRTAASLFPRSAGVAGCAPRRTAARVRRRVGVRRAHGQRIRRNAAGAIPHRVSTHPSAQLRRTLGAADDAARSADREPASPLGRRRHRDGRPRARRPLVRTPGEERRRGRRWPVRDPARRAEWNAPLRCRWRPGCVPISTRTSPTTKPSGMRFKPRSNARCPIPPAHRCSNKPNRPKPISA